VIPITLSFSPNALTREAMTFTVLTDYVTAVQLFNRARRPIYRFTLTYDTISRSHMQELQGLHAAHQGAVPFFWNGGEFGAMENYNLIGVADGHTTTYYLPNRNINTSSFSARMLKPDTGVTSVTGDYFLRAWGQMDFTVTPSSGQEIQAKWACTYLVNFDPNGIKMEQIARNVYRTEFQLIESALVP